MESEPLIDRVREALERNAQKPPIERWNDLVARGAIDSEGRVLLKAPPPMNAEEPKPRSRKRKAKG